jgi:hypothetical protein
VCSIYSGGDFQIEPVTDIAPPMRYTAPQATFYSELHTTLISEVSAPRPYRDTLAG